MKHPLHDPTLPDMVGEWAARQTAQAASPRSANDNAGDDWEDELSDPFLDAVARLEVAATRLW